MLTLRIIQVTCFVYFITKNIITKKKKFNTKIFGIKITTKLIFSDYKAFKV